MRLTTKSTKNTKTGTYERHQGSSLFSVEYEVMLEALLLALPIPTGLKLSAQGCEERATLGKLDQRKTNPERGCFQIQNANR
jgi:hypothetical protein